MDTNLILLILPFIVYAINKIERGGNISLNAFNGITINIAKRKKKDKQKDNA
jgi:hypothetical protein